MDFLIVSLGIIGMNEWVIIAVIVLLLFGGRKIPELMKGLGGGIREFKKASKGNPDKKEKVKKDELE